MRLIQSPMAAGEAMQTARCSNDRSRLCDPLHGTWVGLTPAMNRLSLLVFVLGGCFGGVAGDGKDDSFGGAGAKEDGMYSTCQLAEVLKFVNESTTTVDKLEEIQLSSEAARAIIAHRNGPDGVPGTGDDDIFDDLGELDGVDYVGALALGRLVESILPRCEVDLDSRPFMDSTTFAGSPSGGWARDNQEIEVVLGVTGLTGQRLRSLLLQEDDRGRTLFERLRKSRVMEAFTYSYALDDVPWDTDTQAARELLPYVSLTIESGRFDVDPNDGRRELSLGTDLMDDGYYDTPGYSLLSTDMSLRGRARWDNETTVRRLLIAAKFGTEVDASGNKTNAKIDIRTDTGMTHLATLDDDVRRGKTNWSGSNQPATPVRAIYEQMQEKNLLVDIGSRTGVLVVDAKAHLRSTRSRYHMNESSLEHIKVYYRNAATRITSALAQIDKAQAAGFIPAGETARINALEAKGRAILDKTLLAERITAAGFSVTAANLVLPDSQTAPTTGAALANNRIVAETISAVFHEFADELDDAERIITNTLDQSFDDTADTFRDWRTSVEPSLRQRTTWDSFVNSYRSLSTTANRANSIAAYNAFAQAAGQPTLNDAGWTRLGNYLDRKVISISERQIETAGIAATQLWFDQARRLWVPGSSRALSNFLIDTFDMTEMLSHEEWLSIPEADRTFTRPLPAAKVFNTVLVNEVQIELGSEAAYVARLKELTEKLATNPNDAATKEQLEGATFVWAQYNESMRILAELKGANVLERLQRAGANQNIRWAPPPDSKGNQALKILSDRD